MILSIDTGIKNFGLVILDQAGTVYYTHVIQSKKSKDKKLRVSTDYANRIATILEHIKKVIDKYQPKIITAEMPSFGAQNSSGAISLSVGATIVMATSVLYNIPAVYASPEQIKRVFTGSRKASKTRMMKRCCNMYGWDISYKDIKAKKTREVIRTDKTYHVMNKAMPASYFEHIADAIAAFYTCKQLKEYKEVIYGN